MPNKFYLKKEQTPLEEFLDAAENRNENNFCCHSIIM
jgi:hypothetical protein